MKKIGHYGGWLAMEVAQSPRRSRHYDRVWPSLERGPERASGGGLNCYRGAYSTSVWRIVLAILFTLRSCVRCDLCKQGLDPLHVFYGPMDMSAGEA